MTKRLLYDITYIDMRTTKRTRPCIARGKAEIKPIYTEGRCIIHLPPLCFSVIVDMSIFAESVR